jgi:hypothetical protein
MNEKKQVEYFPFHAINEFMRTDFRLQVIRTSLLELSNSNRNLSTSIDRLTKKYVRVAGFRNSAKAPLSIKAVSMVKAFETHPDLVAVILSAWAESKSKLRDEIFNLLTQREWKLLPLEFDRSKLPGFLPQWPEEDDYEKLYTAFVDTYPDHDASIDETSLMVVWLAGRLPIDKVSKAEMINHLSEEEKGIYDDDNNK